jgi:dihydrolipoamide dehydrogenase
MNSLQTYDVCVIGSGPGGYSCALHCSEAGLKTLLVEKCSEPGGTCLNVGCIPTKALLDSSEHFHFMKKEAKSHGLQFENLSPNFEQMQIRKQTVVADLVKGLDFLLQKKGVEYKQGEAHLLGQSRVGIKTQNEDTVIYASKIVLATGSYPSLIAGATLSKNVLNSTSALNLQEIPKSILVIGGGVIGLEFASVFARLGSEVQIAEFTDSLLPTMDLDCGKNIQRILKKTLGLSVTCQTRALSISDKGSVVEVEMESLKSQKKSVETFEKVLIATGRTPYTARLGLEHTAIQTDGRGFILRNEHFETAEPGVFAIGDVSPGPMLAHKAEIEGLQLAELFISNIRPQPKIIPSVVYSWPEVAGAGATEQELIAQEVPYVKGEMNMRALGRAKAAGECDGFVKVLAHAKSGVVLGIHLIAPRGADLIAEAVVALENKMTAHELAMTCHPHPSYSEALKEAALGAVSLDHPKL